MNSVAVRTLLVRGMLAGVVAGALAFGSAYLMGESHMDAALAYQASHSPGHGGETVSRALQSTAGLATGVLVFGTAVGGIASLVFCFALGRIGNFGPRATAALVAGGAFVTVYAVPFLKYPANPPGTSDPDTLGRRTALYFLMIALSVLLGIGAVILGRRLVPRRGNWNASVIAGTVFVGVVALAMVFLPSVNETPRDFPATLLWRFRLDALAVQALLWASFGLLFGCLAERALMPGTVGGAESDRVRQPAAPTVR